MTLYANADHVFMYVAGLRWDTHDAAGPGRRQRRHRLASARAQRGRVRRPTPGGAVMAPDAASRRWVCGCCGAAGGCGRRRRPASPRRRDRQRRAGVGCGPAAVRQAMRTPRGALAAAAAGAREPDARATAAAAIRAYAERYINWDAEIGDRRCSRGLARASVGQARSAMALEAAQVASDPELAQNGIANSGTVEAVAAAAPGAPSRYVVVTRERTTAALSNAYQGLRPAWHVTVATVAEVAPRRWVVSGWQPEN